MSLVIGDIAGQFDALMRLVAKLPQGEDIILVGDLIDRGPKSREVIEWAMTTPNVRAVRGNHEDMFIDYIDENGKYDYGLYYQNGGVNTFDSYEMPSFPTPEEAKSKVPVAHLRWLKALPLYIEENGYFISHAPIFFNRSLEAAKEFALEEADPDNRAAMTGLLWNRAEPAPIPGLIQVFGHNANWGLKWFEGRVEDGEPAGRYAICLDDSWQEKVTAFDTKTLEIYQEPYAQA